MSDRGFLGKWCHFQGFGSWVSAGIGYSFGNRLELRTSSGNTLYHDHMDGGFSASVALRLRTW